MTKPVVPEFEVVHYPDEFLTCRANGHAWDPFIPAAAPSFSFYLADRCMRCAMERKRIINILGEIAARTYSKVEGYAMPGARAIDFRAEFLRRRMAKAKGRNRNAVGRRTRAPKKGHR